MHVRVLIIPRPAVKRVVPRPLNHCSFVQFDTQSQISKVLSIADLHMILSLRQRETKVHSPQNSTLSNPCVKLSRLWTSPREFEHKLRILRLSTTMRRNSPQYAEKFSTKKSNLNKHFGREGEGAVIREEIQHDTKTDFSLLRVPFSPLLSP